MNINELIKKLENMKLKYGEECKIFYEDDGYYYNIIKVEKIDLDKDKKAIIIK